MGNAVLIVEDEQSASRLIASICAELHLGTQATASGREAQALCAQAASEGAPFLCVVLDLALAELDGFQFALAARGAAWGKDLPLIIVSGIYKVLPPDFAAQARPSAFFAKPFDVQPLRAALTSACGVQAPPSVDGLLEEQPPARLFVDLWRTKATGTLTLSHDATRRVITFQQGQIRFAQSNIKAETMGAAQVEAGIIKQASFDRAVALAKQNKSPLHAALAAARVLSPDQLKVALKQQTVDVCLNALPWTQGTHSFEPQPLDSVAAVPDIRTSPVALVLEGAKKAAPAESKKWLEARAQERIQRSAELERELFSIKNAWAGESVTPLATGGKSVGELLARVKDPELPLLHYLCMSGLLALSGGTRVAKPERPAPADDEDKGKVFTTRESAARRMLFAERERLAEATHYDVLGVGPEVNAEDLKQAYFNQAKRFHSDSFSGVDLGTAGRAAEDLFSKVNEAYQVLSDKEKRVEYDVFLDRTAKGLPTDVGAILRAESIFQKGELLFKAGKWEDAEALFREAIALNHTEAEFHAYLGMAMFKGRGGADEALQQVEKGLQLDPRLRSGVLFAAQLLDELGDTERGTALLRRAIDKDPDFSDGKDLLRKLREKPGGQKKGGFFGRLLKK